jgi:glycerol-3-phosphate dehydrogenase
MFERFDVVVIGAGIAGCAVARELSKHRLSIAVVDKGHDVAVATTRANSGIVHAGYDPQPGTLKAHYNVVGSRMYPQLAQELRFGYHNTGSLVVAFSEDERPALEVLRARGVENGVPGLDVIDADELLRREPNIGSEAVAALWVPTGAICDPFSVALAYGENAVSNGAVFSLGTEVLAIERSRDGFVITIAYDGDPVSPFAGKGDLRAGARRIEARCIVNAAGVYADTVNDMVARHRFSITPREGEYCLYDTGYGSLFSSTIFQTPSAAGKGVLVTPTTGGNLLVGPNAVARDDREDNDTYADDLDGLLKAAKRTWNGLSGRGIICNFAGLRASGDTGDFVIGEAPDVPRFFNIACLESPGLSAAPAIAVDVAAQVAECLGAEENPDFDPHRIGTPRFGKADDAQRDKLIAEDSRWGHLICRCQEVPEAEVVAAVHGIIPATTIDGVKWRTGATMGRCQGGFCIPVIAAIIARERGIDIAEVTKRGGDSPILAGALEGSEAHV